MNKASFIGNAGQAPTITNLPSGEIVAQFSLATSEDYIDKEGNPQRKTEWHRIVAWGKTAQAVKDFVKKGSTVGITAQAVSREYEQIEKIAISKTKTIDHTIKRYVTEFRAYDIKVY